MQHFYYHSISVTYTALTAVYANQRIKYTQTHASDTHALFVIVIFVVAVVAVVVGNGVGGSITNIIGDFGAMLIAHRHFFLMLVYYFFYMRLLMIIMMMIYTRISVYISFQTGRAGLLCRSLSFSVCRSLTRSLAARVCV